MKKEYFSVLFPFFLVLSILFAMVLDTYRINERIEQIEKALQTSEYLSEQYNHKVKQEKAKKLLDEFKKQDIQIVIEE